MSKARSAACGVCLLLLASGCGSEPTAAALEAGEAVDATSALGLATGKLSVVGNLATGSNDFELTLAREAKAEAAQLKSFTAMMPAHGHLAMPYEIDYAEDAYRIVGLTLSMPGVWRLTGNLSVDGAPDSISFDVDVP